MQKEVVDGMCAEARYCWACVQKQCITGQVRISRLSMVSMQKLVTDVYEHKQDITGQVCGSRILLGESADEGYRSESVQKQGNAGQICQSRVLMG